MYTSMDQGRLTLVAKIRMNVQTKTRRLQKNIYSSSTVNISSKSVFIQFSIAYRTHCFTVLYISHALFHCTVHITRIVSLYCAYRTHCFTVLYISHALFHCTVHIARIVSLYCTYRTHCFTVLYISHALFHCTVHIARIVSLY